MSALTLCLLPVAQAKSQTILNGPADFLKSTHITGGTPESQTNTISRKGSRKSSGGKDDSILKLPNQLSWADIPLGSQVCLAAQPSNTWMSHLMRGQQENFGLALWSPLGPASASKFTDSLTANHPKIQELSQRKTGQELP